MEMMNNGEMRYRVYNRCHYDIGVQLLSGLGVSIKPNSFQVLTGNDILYIESVCNGRKFFGEKMLVAYDMQNKEVPFEQIGIFADEAAVQHYSDKEIEDVLKGPVKKMEAWIDKINEPSELHAIFEVAKKLDLTSAKLKVLAAKMPDKEFI